NTADLSAASFNQKQIYVFVENDPNYNYFKYLI
ncbi:MAG: GNAT family N-acetyltransferase, partial [Acinetobacter sp.]|nr:GNAT family N-acetyltransferase [Acinetobacter sp.]